MKTVRCLGTKPDGSFCGAKLPVMINGLRCTNTDNEKNAVFSVYCRKCKKTTYFIIDNSERH